MSKKHCHKSKETAKKSWMKLNDESLLAVHEVIAVTAAPADHAPGSYVWFKGKQEALFFPLAVNEIYDALGQL